MGRYNRKDPFGVRGDAHAYAYGQSNPALFIDPLGEKSRTCCTPITGGALGAFKHCFIQVQDDTTKKNTTYFPARHGE